MKWPKTKKRREREALLRGILTAHAVTRARMDAARDEIFSLVIAQMNEKALVRSRKETMMPTIQPDGSDELES